jgi:mono/diheme cytochrome c family protein
LILAGCGSKPSAPDQSPVAAGTVDWSQNGWSGDERAEYHHLAEGSELMPYALLSNVVSVKTGKPFLENMERFGFLPDAAGAQNPRGLPIGLTTVHSRDKNHIGLEMVGFNCAACHVGEVSYQGKWLRIDGAPSLVDLQSYQVEFKGSLDATLRDPAKAVALAVAMARTQRAGDGQSPADVSSYASDPAAKTAGEVAAASTADKNFHSVSSRKADSATGATPGGESFAASWHNALALAKARLAYLKNGKLLLDGTEPGPGRIDAFGAARNLLFPKDPIRMQSPVSFPFIWDVPDTTQQRSGTDAVWIHYDGNTNSILERNIGQALGMGAVFDPNTYESTLRIANLHRLEVLTHKLTPPQWPAGMLGAIDPAKAAAGAKIFNDTCRDCHQNRLYALTDVGTDPQRANSFGQPVAGGMPFPAAIKPILDNLKARAFLDDGVSPADQAAMDANPVIWRATGQYLARPLTGVWATAPYLHNGSVPTLWHLLHPGQRPATFFVGYREYDPVKVGYSTGGSGWTFDTSQPGNSNIGHAGDRYGTNLTEDQKNALIEYLKTL